MCVAACLTWMRHSFYPLFAQMYIMRMHARNILLTSHNTLYSSLLKIKYPKYSFALYISPLYLCITKPDHHIIYSTDEEVFINRILNGGAHGTVRALRGRVRDDRHIGLRPRRQDMYLLIRDVFFPQPLTPPAPNSTLESPPNLARPTSVTSRQSEAVGVSLSARLLIKLRQCKQITSFNNN